MAEDDVSANKSVSYKSYQSHLTGVVPLPPGSRGPRSLYLRKHADSFGFTLRHFIVYPPSTIQERTNTRHAAVGALHSPMDTIFVKHVSLYSAAEQAGLQHGDRIVAVNGVLVNDKTYKQVIQLIQCSPEYLHLLVVPKEDDVLQKFFSETAHNPISNQQIKSERRRLQRPLHQHQQNFTAALQADDLSWKSLLDSTNCGNVTSCKQYQQRSTDNLLYSNSKDIVYDQNLQNIDDPFKRRAQPQVPVYRKMGRRASEGSTFSNKDLYQYDNFAITSVSTRSSDMVVGETNMKSSAKTAYPKNITHFETTQSLLHGNTAGCRLSLDGGRRRESSPSISSSIADGSKDSLSSYDSISTLTGPEIDDSIIMSRLRKNLLQKEEFLRRPSHPIEPPTIQREFYGRPKKLEKCTWPPNENNCQESPSRTAKPLHQNFQRVKSDIDTERDLNSQLHGMNYTGGDIYNISQQNTNSLRDWCGVPTSQKIREATPAPSALECPGEMNGALTIEDEDRRLYLTNLQMVSKRTKQFESGRPLPEDDLMLKDRTSFYKSELARLSSKRVVPHVMIRAHEFESRSNEPIHTTSGSCTNTILRRQHRDSRSLDSHDEPQDCQSQSNRMRERSNSAESWTAVMNLSGEKRKGFREISYNTMDHTANVGEYGVVVRRVKNNSIVADEDRAMRRESYLKATGNGRMQEEELSDGEICPQIRSSHRKWRPPIFPGDIQQLRKLFEDAAYSLGGSLSGGSTSTISLERDKTSMPSSPLEKEGQLIKEGLLHCKIASIDGKRAADRSWKQVWVVLKEQKLFLYKDRHHQSPSDAVEQSLASGVDMSTSCVRIAEDYTKRKNVLRVTSILPCRSELLLQTDNNVELADWVKILQEKVDTDIDMKSEGNVTMKQQAMPQTIPGSTSVQVVECSRSSPESNISKLPSLRNRSPTGQSPVSKTRKPSQGNEVLATSKTKTWKGRVVKQFRKIQGAGSPSSPTAPEGSTFGVPLDHCYPSNINTHIPRLVEVCTEIVENRGLDVVGVYRVPGNSAAITALTNSVNINYEGVPQLDAHWNDVHVVSSLLKSFFRKLPDALLTSNLYSNFIEADKIKDPTLRMEEIRKLVCCLPLHHYHTLKHLMLHLKKVTNNCKVNKMEGRNLAIVFGPTLIRAVQDDMATLVNDMTHNYKIVESLISYANWFFLDDGASSLNLTSTQPVEPLNNELDVASNRALLLDNISKVEGIKVEKVPGRELFSSIISAAHRKMRKGTKVNIGSDVKDELNGLKEFILESNFSTDPEQILPEGKSNNIPTTIIEIEKSSQTADRGTYFNYSDQENYRRRIKNFIQETEANLQRNRKTTEFYSDNFDPNVSRDLQNLNQATMSHSNIISFNTITKMQSASNVFYRPVNGSTRHSTNSALTMQYAENPSALDNAQSVGLKSTNKSISFDVNENKEHINIKDVKYQNFFKKNVCDSNNFGPKPFDKTILRRGSSAETINTSIMDLSSSGTMKKIKFGNEIDISQRTSSLDSLYKTPDDDGGDLQSSIMKIFDEKKKSLNPLVGTDLPYADEAPERPGFDIISYKNKGILPTSPKLYRNPSLHKSLLDSTKFAKLTNTINFKTKELQKENIEEEKDKDCFENVPDNERHISEKQNVNGFDNKANANFNFRNTDFILRRSESLNKPEPISLPNNKLKRSESLNKTSDRLKRSDSLSKNEKTENNINKRRELTAAIRRCNKDLPKLKRKNGMPERSIKRRHTVGGTKDFDKVNWLDNRYQEENTNMKKCPNEKCTLRTSSPDLSSMRRERLFFEVNLVGPENMIVALRQHLIGPRPQSLPEARVFNVPLESHV